LIEQVYSARRGQNLVELALVLPVCLWILLGIVDFGRVYYTYVAATNAAREGARWWVANPAATTAQIQTRVQQEGAPQVTSFASITPSSPAVDQRRVQVQFAFTPLTPLIGSLWGGGALTLTAQATMPTLTN
jgi:Flp pilus assembly protein TadG